jgi:hypothetical protein
VATASWRLPAHRDGSCSSGARAAVNDVGKPCAGEPHARFEVAGAGNGVARSAIRGSQAGVLRNATTMAWSGPSRPISRYRASARPYWGFAP